MHDDGRASKGNGARLTSRPVGGTEVAWLWQRQGAAGDMSPSGRAADVREGTGGAPASGWEGDGCPGQAMDCGRSAGCVRVHLRNGPLRCEACGRTRERAAADSDRERTTREEREGQSTESESESPPEQPGLSRGGWRLLEAFAADRARPRVKGQKVTQSRPPPAPAPAAATHSCSPCSLFCTSSAGGGGGRAGAGQYLYAGVGRGYHAACLVSSPPLAQI